MSPLFRRRRDEEPAIPDSDDEFEPDDEPEDELDEEPDEEPDEATTLPDRSDGPWDLSERPDTEGLVDLGAIRVIGRDGMELRLEVEEATGLVTAATIQLEGSAVQLQAFAAPRSQGIWDEIRTEIAAGISRQGGTVDEVPGPFGRELIARIPVRTPDGRTGHQPARFVGVDGPRWFLRAVFHGPAVYEPEPARVMESVLRDVVVVRGAEAMAPRDLLPLRLPGVPGVPTETEAEAESRPPIEPFRRGPEITEIH